MLWPLHLRGSRARLPGVQEGDTAQPGVWTLLHLGSSRPPVAPAPAVSQVWGHLQIVTWQHCCGTKIHAAEMKESAMDLQSSHHNRDARGKSWLVWTWHAREAKREPVRHCGYCIDRLNCSPAAILQTLCQGSRGVQGCLCNSGLSDLAGLRREPKHRWGSLPRQLGNCWGPRSLGTSFKSLALRGRCSDCLPCSLWRFRIQTQVNASAWGFLSKQKPWEHTTFIHPSSIPTGF